MGPKCTRSEPEVGQKWNVRDLQARPAIFHQELTIKANIYWQNNFIPYFDDICGNIIFNIVFRLVLNI